MKKRLSFLLALAAFCGTAFAGDLPHLKTADKECTSSSPNDVFADLLIWTAKESGTENWGLNITNNIDMRAVDFGVGPGFRLGFGHQFCHGQWDSQLYFSHFETTGKGQTSSTAIVTSPYLANFYVNNPSGLANSGATYHAACIRWGIDFNVLDWELGRACVVQDSLTLRPFIGLKAGVIGQRIRTFWAQPNVTTFQTASENLKNNYWGIGPSGGLNTSWKMGSVHRNSFFLFGDFSGALMWGHWRFADDYKNNGSQEVHIFFPTIKSAAAMFRGFMGLEWAFSFHGDQAGCGVRIGYESQIWLNQLQLYTLNEGRLSNQLTLQGGTFNVSFNF